MALLSVGMVSVQAALREANYTRAIARDRTDARFLLEQVVGAVEIQPTLNFGTVNGEFPDHPRFSYTYEISAEDVPAPPVPTYLPPSAQAAAANFQLPVSMIGHLKVTVDWTRLGRDYSETVETLFPPERLPKQQLEEYRFQHKMDKQGAVPR